MDEPGTSLFSSLQTPLFCDGGPGSAESADNSCEPRQCRVCCDKSDGAHFGIDSCRACAAFFRRSVVMKKNYVCRQGQNACIINKSIRCMCRKCRMRKCVEAGMLPECVQSKRDHIIPRIPQVDITAGALPLIPPPSISESVIMSPPSAFHVVQPIVTHSSPIPSSSSSSATNFSPLQLIGSSELSNEIKPIEQPHLLSKIATNYRHLCSVRKSTEQSLQMSSVKGIFDEEQMQGFSLANMTKISKIYKAHLPAVGEFLNDTFVEFSSLNQEEKWTMFQPFIACLWGMESSYRTYKMLPPEEYSKNIVTETLFIDMDDLNDFFNDINVSDVCRQNIINIVSSCFLQSRITVLNQMKKLEIAEEEFAALVALALFSPDYSAFRTNISTTPVPVPIMQKSNEKLDDLSSVMRSVIFRQLHVFYSNKSPSESADRLGQLMCLFCAIQHSCTRMKEDMELYNLFDVFTSDSFLYDLVKRS